MFLCQRRLGLLLALGVALLPLCGGNAGDKKPAAKNETFIGNVVRLADFLAKKQVQVDPDAFALVLQTEDGKIHPLVKDGGSRMFYKDAKVLNRPMRLTARRVPDSPYLQVITVQSVVKGKLHDVYYWCDVCSIKRFESGICDCCGDPMLFREEPSK